MVRLATAHRVTDDLDAVTWIEDGTLDAPIAVLLEHGATRSRNGVDLGDVHIDLIAVSDYERDQLPVDVDDAMFVITHTYGHIRPLVGDLADVRLRRCRRRDP